MRYKALFGLLYTAIAIVYTTYKLIQFIVIELFNYYDASNYSYTEWGIVI